MKQIVLVIFTGFNIIANAQNVGIGITAPTSGLHIINDNGVIVKGTINSGAVINESGAGSKFIFNPRKGGAIRAGYLSDIGIAYWDDVSTGYYSIALGHNSKASNSGSVAIGENAIATGTNSTAIGYGCSAEVANSICLSGVGCYAKSQFSVAIGNYASANRYGSVAIGRNINAGYTAAGYGENSYAIGIGDNTNFTVGGHYATGARAFAFGNNCRSVGDRAFAIGNDCEAGQFFESGQTGRYSFSIGNSCSASGIFSFAIGNNANTNGHAGAMVLGSRVDGVSVISPADYHFLAQFAGGYQLQSNNAGTLGVYLNPNTSSWASICDKNRKEMVLPMNDEEVLNKLAAIDYTSWKYIDDPDISNRHYGIMAQDFYAAFGKDDLGKIGNDTLVNPVDLLGVAYSAIKALEKRTDEIITLKSENMLLKARLEKLEMLITKRKAL
ncbi:MAG: tail fiber domain-containing protein [Bacteroidota bacterium]